MLTAIPAGLAEQLGDIPRRDPQSPWEWRPGDVTTLP